MRSEEARARSLALPRACWLTGLINRLQKSSGFHFPAVKEGVILLHRGIVKLVGIMCGMGCRLAGVGEWISSSTILFERHEMRQKKET